MANRFNIKGEVRHGQHPLSGGYPTEQFGDDTIPPVGLEDVDTALFRLFDKELPLQVTDTESNGGTKKVPVIFAGGEKWALLKRNKPLRDKNNVLILPLITIGRTNFVQNVSDDMNGRGINQKTGEIVIRRRLDRRDRAYQNLVNRQGLSNIPGVIQPGSGSNTGVEVGDTIVRDGGLLAGNKTKNVFETLVVPSPQFITVTYDIIVWTQYTHHMNQIMETLISSYLPQFHGWRLDTPKGYWFLANVEEGSQSQENNFDDMSQGERLIKMRLSVRVQAYILASQAPGAPIAVKKYISVPDITFKSAMPEDPTIISGDYESDPFLGSDDPTLPLDSTGRSARRDKRFTGPDLLIPPDADPALQSFPRGKKPPLYKKLPDGRYVKITSSNSRLGETAYTSTGGINDISDITFEE
jgi:hypothetical protein